MANKDFENINDNEFSFDDESVVIPTEAAETEEEDIVKVIKKDKKKKSKHGKAKRKNIVKSVIWIVAIVLISVILASTLIIGTGEYLGIGPGRGKEVVVEIEAGMSTRQIATRLKESGAINNSLAFLIYSKISGNSGKYSYGVYVFNNEIGYEDLAELLMTNGAKAETKTVTIPEGAGINDYTKNVNGNDVKIKGIATILEEAGVCTRADFLAALSEVGTESKLFEGATPEKTYFALEGYLFPDTYNFYAYDSKECARLAVNKMLGEMEKRLTDEMITDIKEKGYTVNQILTMASIVQLESGGNAAEAKNVAAVFYNRLNSTAFPTLGSSPTCYYGRSFKHDDGRYDTYKVKGLPPGPLCAPSMAAIEAAIYPTENSPYYYFVTDATGKFYFHKTGTEQQNTINKLKRDNNWIYEYLD